MIDYGYFKIHEVQLEEWQRVYPQMSVEQEMLKMVEWLKANPRKANKTLWRKFIIGWLNRTHASLVVQQVNSRIYASAGSRPYEAPNKCSQCNSTRNVSRQFPYQPVRYLCESCEGAK